MITIHSNPDQTFASATAWWVHCEACAFMTDPVPLPSPAVAAALEHQRRCHVMTGAPVRWERDGVDLGLVTPMLGLSI